MQSPNLDDIYSLMGCTLSYIQSVERHINFITTFVLQGEGDLTLEKLNSINKKENKKALGYFIGKIKERVELHQSLEELLGDFLKNRNDFIHNQDKIPEWDLDTEEGVLVARNFTASLLVQGHKINEIFAALTISWQQHTGIYPPGFNEKYEFTQKIEEKYGALIDVLFTEKN